MARSLLKSCSVLGVALALCMTASPAAAAGKKKKAAAEESSEPKSTDDLMEDSLAADTRKASDDPEAGDTASETEEEESFEEPDAWERPPVEAEKPRAAEAKAPVEDDSVGDGMPLMIGLTLGYGFKTDRATGGLGADPYGFELGVRGGYTFDFGLYTGVFYNYYIGSTESGGASRIGGTGEASANYMQFGLEAGYDVWLGSVIFRPSLQIGLAIAQSESTTRTIASQSVTSMMFGPGAWIVYPMDSWFVGGDGRITLVAGDGVTGISLSANGGLRF